MPTANSVWLLAWSLAKSLLIQSLASFCSADLLSSSCISSSVSSASLIGRSTSASCCKNFKKAVTASHWLLSRSLPDISKGTAALTKWWIWDNVPENIWSRNHSLVACPSEPQVRGDTQARSTASISSFGFPTNIKNPFIALFWVGKLLSMYHLRFLSFLGTRSQCKPEFVVKMDKATVNPLPRNATAFKILSQCFPFHLVWRWKLSW